MSIEKDAVLRWHRGHAAAAARVSRLRAERGPQPTQAIAECLSALNLLETAGSWPGPRDPVSERAVEEVRRGWSRIQRRAQASRAR